MRLDELLANTKDISWMVAQHLDAAALFRLSMASKDSRKCVHQSEVLYACVLRTFPGITGVPKGMGCGYYAESFKGYYFNEENFSMPYLEVVTLIGISIKHDLGSYESSDDEDVTPMSLKVSVLLREIKVLFTFSSGRKKILKGVREWKAVYEDDFAHHFYFHDDASEILNRIKKIAKRKFVWEDRGAYGRVGI